MHQNILQCGILRFFHLLNGPVEILLLHGPNFIFITAIKEREKEKKQDNDSGAV